MADDTRSDLINGVVGMYVHQHWPYDHPYSARTWSLGDWRGYAGGLRKLGYNTIMIWPMLETIPDPMTPSDKASLEKHGQVIDLLHRELGMSVFIVICPNIRASSAASQATFEARHFFWSREQIDPGDAVAVRSMMVWREKLFAYLKTADGVAIIDSDPGGYPNSSTAEFISLLNMHRQMLDRLRPGIELDYWIWTGWRAAGRSKASGVFQSGAEEEFADTFAQLVKANPVPWGLLDGLQSHELAASTKANHDQLSSYVRKSGLEDRAISFDYGAIESEPSLPMTNFGGNAAFDAGSALEPRGVMGNAQTHAVQLPNTFAFARGALGKSITAADYIRFANDLLPARGRQIVAAWKALSGTNSSAMRAQALTARHALSETLQVGPLGGLIFGNPRRFMLDLALQLEFKAALQDLRAAQAAGKPLASPLRTFGLAFDAWQRRTGFTGYSDLPDLKETLRALNAPEINAVLDSVSLCEKDKCSPERPTNEAQLRANEEIYTRELSKAVGQASVPQ